MFTLINLYVRGNGIYWANKAGDNIIWNNVIKSIIVAGLSDWLLFSVFWYFLVN